MLPRGQVDEAWLRGRYGPRPGHVDLGISCEVGLMVGRGRWSVTSESLGWKGQERGGHLLDPGLHLHRPQGPRTGLLPGGALRPPALAVLGWVGLGSRGCVISPPCSRLLRFSTAFSLPLSMNLCPFAAVETTQRGCRGRQRSAHPGQWRRVSVSAAFSSSLWMGFHLTLHLALLQQLFSFLRQ